jgi:hypothetical protein
MKLTLEQEHKQHRSTQNHKGHIWQLFVLQRWVYFHFGYKQNNDNVVNYVATEKIHVFYLIMLLIATITQCRW